MTSLAALSTNASQEKRHSFSDNPDLDRIINVTDQPDSEHETPQQHYRLLTSTTAPNNNNNNNGVNSSDKPNISVLKQFRNNPTHLSTNYSPRTQQSNNSIHSPLLPHNNNDSQPLSSLSFKQRLQLLFTWSTVVSLSTNRTFLLCLYSVLLLLSSVGNSIYFKQMINHMPNYVYFLNQFTSVIFVPIFFAVVAYQFYFTNHITAEMVAFPKRKFATMGTFDSLSGVLVMFGAIGVSGSNQALLSNSVIPVTMALSWFILKQRFRILQILGSIIIMMGIGFVLIPNALQLIGLASPVLMSQSAVAVEPQLQLQLQFSDSNNRTMVNDVSSLLQLLSYASSDDSHAGDCDPSSSAGCSHTISDPSDDTPTASTDVVAASTEPEHDIPFFDFLFILSSVPSALSSIYKELAFVDADIDANYLQAWVAFYQLLLGFALIPINCLSILGSVAVPFDQLLSALSDGWWCLLGYDTIVPPQCSLLHSTDSLPVCDSCRGSWIPVSLYLIFNLLFNVFTVLLIKYGSATLMFIIMTLRLPMVQYAFSLRFFNNPPDPFDETSIVGLLIILVGLALYRWPAAEDAEDFSDNSAASLKSHIMPFIPVLQNQVFARVHHERYVTRQMKGRTAHQIRSAFYTQLGVIDSPTTPHSGRRFSPHINTNTNNKQINNYGTMLQQPSSRSPLLTAHIQANQTAHKHKQKQKKQQRTMQTLQPQWEKRINNTDMTKQHQQQNHVKQNNNNSASLVSDAIQYDSPS